VLKTDPDKLYEKAQLVFQFSINNTRFQEVEKDIDELLALYLKHHPDVKISSKVFLEMLGKQLGEISAEILEKVQEEKGEQTVAKICNVISFIEAEYLLSLNAIFEQTVRDSMDKGLSPAKIDFIFEAKKNNIWFTEKDPESTTIRTLANISLFLKNCAEDLDNLHKDLPPKLKKEWMEIYRSLTDEGKKFIEFDNECEENKKEYLNMMKEINLLNEKFQKLSEELSHEFNSEHSEIEKKFQEFNIEFDKKRQEIDKKLLNTEKKSRSSLIKRLRN
jgi:hypothetical protein